MYRIFSTLMTFLLIAAGILLGVLNPAPVSVDLFWTQIELPLSILLAVSIVFGLLLAGFYALSHLMQLRWKLRKSEKQNRAQMDEIIRLKKEFLEQQKSHSAVIAPVQATEPP
ncbi:MAG: LapA family protein [Hydrogenovibrio sp.]